MQTTVTELEPDVLAPPSEAVREIPAINVEPPVRWRLVTRIAFRFCVLYFGLYVLLTQMFYGMFPWPWGGLPSPGQIPWLRTFTSWVATGVFKFPKPLMLLGGSGDKPYDYAFVAALLAFSVVATVLWSILDRKRPSYVGFHKWFRVFVRFGLGGTMVTYGTIKAFPMQMSYPNLTRLLEPYGHFSLMGVLWAKIGASPAYETFIGCVELAAGILLFIPGLTTAGALLALAATAQVFALNMTYDVPVKLFSLQLVLMSLVLLAPDAKRLLAVILGRGAGPSTVPALVRSRKGRWIAIGLQLAAGAWIVGVSFNANLTRYRTNGPGAPKPPLYGIWTVEKMTIDGIERAPLVTDYDRWRRVVIQNPVAISFQRMDDTFTLYGAKVDMAGKTIALTKGVPSPINTSPTPPAGRLTLEQPSPERLFLAGEMDGRKVWLQLKLFDRSSFRLVQSQFRWIQDLPFNR